MALSNEYTSLASYQKAFNDANAHQGSSGAAIEQAASQFNSLFRNLVGRDPSADEANQFYSSHFALRPWEYGDAGSRDYQALGDTAKSFINDNYQQAMQDSVNQKLQSQQGEANRLADLFRQQGNTAINGVEQSLLGYQQKLFEKLRPNLITSLQAQGLLNTGGFNEALAGQQADLANEGARQIADLKYQNEQQANAIAFGGASAPYEFQRAQALNQLPYMQQQAQTSLGNLFQQRFADQQYGNQMSLLNRQGQLARENRPSFLGSLGQSFATNFGGGMGQNVAGWFNPNRVTLNSSNAGMLMGGM